LTQAFLDEIEASVPALRRYARALTRDADRADDLVQDCLERAIRKRALWKPTGPLRAWLFRILLNLYRNQLRLTRRRGEHVPVDLLVVEPSVAPAQPGRIALAEMSRAIETLVAEQREALLLVVLEGLSYAEAADVLEIPMGTLMSRLGRARAALRIATGNVEEPHLRTVK
jgi:RNA polymerase sigma-70 factor, ECF subfamily